MVDLIGCPAFGWPRQLADLQALQGLRQRHYRVDFLQKRPGGLGAFCGPMGQAGSDLDHMQGQHLLQVDRSAFDAEVQPVRDEVELALDHAGAPLLAACSACKGSSPARRSRSQVRIKGRPIKAVGSSE